MPRPVGMPIGLRLDAVAREASRAFDVALTAAGGSRPIWLVLLALRTGQADNQRQLADQIGIRGATLTHHLGSMESRGLVTRTREAGDRRNQRVVLTAEGEAMFGRLRQAAVAFDRTLRRGISADEIRSVDAVLQRLAANVAG